MISLLNISFHLICAWCTNAHHSRLSCVRISVFNCNDWWNWATDVTMYEICIIDSVPKDWLKMIFKHIPIEYITMEIHTQTHTERKTVWHWFPSRFSFENFYDEKWNKYHRNGNIQRVATGKKQPLQKMPSHLTISLLPHMVYAFP